MKLIFCDMDGTLLNHQLKITPYTLDKLMALQEKGVGIILSSGRHIESLKKYGQQLHFENYPMSGYSCTNGLAYYDHLGQLRLEYPHLTYDDYLIVKKYAKEHHYGFICYTDRRRIFGHYHESLIKRLFHFNKPLQPHETIDKFVFFGRPSFDVEGLDYSCSLVDAYWLEIGPKGVDKGTMLKKIADYHQIDVKEILAFGNGENDLPMLIQAGEGIAMGNAFDHVKKHSDAICDDCEHDGIGRYLVENGYVEYE